jgi:hypothetical protein
MALLFCALVNAQSLDPPLQGKATSVYIWIIGAKGKGIHLFRLQPAGDEVFQNQSHVREKWRRTYMERLAVLYSRNCAVTVSMMCG